MLKSISCTVLREPMMFKDGLNVILGDDAASNSIGKTSALLLIDFAFGGDSYPKLKRDAIEALGHHTIYFTFQFNSREYHFARSTEHPGLVSQQEHGNATPISASELKIAEFHAFLRRMYGLENFSSSFRALASLYFRIWGKDNYQTERPLHAFPRQPTAEAIQHLVSILAKDSLIKEIEKDLKLIESRKDNLDKAFRTAYLPQISTKQYSVNKKIIEDAGNEIAEIRNNLAKYAISIREIVNRNVLDWKSEKDALLEEKEQCERKIRIAEYNLSNIHHVTSKSFSKLTEFFPAANHERLSFIQNFHSGLSKILKREIEESRSKSISFLTGINKQIAELDAKLNSSTDKMENPGAIIDRTIELLQKQSDAVRGNRAYEDLNQLKDDHEFKVGELAKEKDKRLAEIQVEMNTWLHEMSDWIYKSGTPWPQFAIIKNDYSYHIANDSGTGRSYVNLLLFDLALFEKTSLPAIAHDSHLFKNIENSTFAKLVQRYSLNSKQSFISIDEGGKYGFAFNKIIADKIRVRLSRAEPLFKIDWRLQTQVTTSDIAPAPMPNEEDET